MLLLWKAHLALANAWLLPAGEARGCNHDVAQNYWVESINGETPFLAHPCQDWDAFQAGQCNTCGKGCLQMGFHVKKKYVTFKDRKSSKETWRLLVNTWIISWKQNTTIMGLQSYYKSLILFQFNGELLPEDKQRLALRHGLGTCTTIPHKHTYTNHNPIAWEHKMVRRALLSKWY